MIVLILVLIWLVVLTPAITHRLSSTDAFSSVMRFHSDARLLRKILGHREDSLPLSSRSLDRSGLTHREQALRCAERERTRKERQRAVARRRRAVLSLLVALVGSLAVGAMPKLHLFWVLSAVAGVLLLSYLALLAHYTRQEANVAERRAKVVHLPRTIFPVVLNDAQHHDGVRPMREGYRYKIAFATNEAR